MYRGPTSGSTKVLAHHQDQGDDKVDYGRQELSSKKGVLGVQKKFITSVWLFLAILAIKMADFLKLEHFLRPFL